MLKVTKGENIALLGDISKMRETAEKLKETNEFLEVQVHSSEESLAQLESQVTPFSSFPHSILHRLLFAHY
jgi:hypothetical protein